MTLLNPVQKKLHRWSLVVPKRVVFLGTRPYVMRNDTAFTNVTSFTSLCMCSKFFLPIWILDLWYPGTCYLVQEVLVLHLFVCIQSFVYKNASKSAQFSRCLWTFDNFPQNCIVTVVLVCPTFALHEFIILENSIGFLYSGPVFLSFLPMFIIVASQFVLFICTCLLPFHTSTTTSPFLQIADCPLYKRMASHSRSDEMPLSPCSATNSLVFLSSNVTADLTLL
jgi:hypothetical protein